MDTSILHDYDPVTDTCVTWLFIENDTTRNMLNIIQRDFSNQFGYPPPAIKMITSKRYRPSRWLAGPVVGELHDV